MSQKINNTHTTWAVWYHNPSDKNWDLNSYSKLYEFSSLEDFWKLYTNWNEYLPSCDEGMFFIMRMLKNNNYINPLWEDKYNRNGGFWSFKINKNEAKVVWETLSVYLISEKICKSLDDSMLINGISISPKRNFCIIKIWNNDSNYCDKMLLNNDISVINYNECMYKSHLDNIANDKIKIQKTNNKFKKGGKQYFSK